MTSLHWMLFQIDGLLIAPYRWFQDPMLGWFAGTMVLAVWSTVLGEFSLALAYRGNRGPIRRLLRKTRYYHEQSFEARRAGDRKAYQGINRLANESYGRSFFLLLAMGMGSLWPAFLALAWLDLRFGDLTFPLPAWTGGAEPGVAAPFLALYLLARFLLARVKPLIVKDHRRAE